MATAGGSTTAAPGFNVARQATTPATTSVRTVFGARWRHSSGAVIATTASTPCGDRPRAEAAHWPSASSRATSATTSGTSRVSAALRTRLIARSKVPAGEPRVVRLQEQRQVLPQEYSGPPLLPEDGRQVRRLGRRRG